MKTLGKSIRYTLTILLLIVVWFHSHWSVALCLTLSAIQSEAVNTLYVYYKDKYKF